MPDIKYMHVQEFRDGGYLQEVNRLVLHPLGLALEVSPNDDGHLHAKVWDYRDDPEGIYFAEGTIKPEKAVKVCDEVLAKRAVRTERLGYVVQPVKVGLDDRALTTNYLGEPPSVHPDLEFEQ